MNKLVSEQLPNDGSYHIDRLVKEANNRLKQTGRQGKRATIVTKKTSLTLQFTLHDGNGNSQKNVGLGAIPVSAKGIEKAEEIATLVTGQLLAGTFTWDWFYQLIGKDTSEKSKQLTCKEMLEQFKKHYFKQRKNNKYPEKSWYERCRRLEEVISELNKPLSLALIREVIEGTENNTEGRTRTISGLVEFLRYFDNNDYKNVIKEYKKSNNPKRKKRSVPSDKKIAEIYQSGFTPYHNKLNYIDRFKQWQFLYGLLATYGLRIHEAWSIANWNEPVILKDGDWITVDVGDGDSIELEKQPDNLIIPAIRDPNNKHHILCIKHDTKTGYRMAMPISPDGHDWIEEFNLLQSLNLPEIENPLKKTGEDGLGSFRCTEKTTAWFKKKQYGFTPHDLRHAYNHRGHHLGVNPKSLADSLGHSLTMNTTGYLRHMSDVVKLQGMKEAMHKEQNKRSELDLANERIKELEAKLEAAENKMKRYEAELRMYQTLAESQSKN